MSFSNKDISLKKYNEGYVLKVNPELNFEKALDLLQKDLIAHSDILGEALIVGVHEHTFDSLQKGKLIELFSKYSNLSVKSLESLNIYSDLQKKSSDKKKAEKKKKTFKALDKFKLKNQADFEVSDFTIVESPEPENEEFVDFKPVEKMPQNTPEKAQDKEKVQDKKVQAIQPTQATNEILPPIASQIASEDLKTLFFRGTVRSGNTLQSQGHLVVIGDVNEGSELYATGNIVVVGTLRGMAHAGCEGDESAFIMANKLLSNQIRISKHISIRTDEQSKVKHLKIAEIIDDKIVIK